MSDHYFKRLMAVFATAALLGWLGLTSCHAASFPYITLNKQTNRLSDNGTAITFNGTPLGGSGNVVASGTNDVGWLLTASTNDGVHGVWSAPIWAQTNWVDHDNEGGSYPFQLLRPVSTNGIYVAAGNIVVDDTDALPGTGTPAGIMFYSSSYGNGTTGVNGNTNFFAGIITEGGSGGVDVGGMQINAEVAPSQGSAFYFDLLKRGDLDTNAAIFEVIGHLGSWGGTPSPDGQSLARFNWDYSDTSILSIVARDAWPAGDGLIGINVNEPSATIEVAGFSGRPIQKWTQGDGTLMAQVPYTGGFGSYATGTITTSATGATNTLSANVVLYVTAATSATLKDNAGTTEFSGVTIAGFTPVRLQPGGTFIGTSITYATGTASHAW